jgi:hypothetical protein
MTIPARFRSPRYNKLKKRALEVFERHGTWLAPPNWAVLAHFFPTRAAYSYLKRLHHFGLLDRDSAERVCYRLSDKGRKRLVVVVSDAAIDGRFFFEMTLGCSLTPSPFCQQCYDGSIRCSRIYPYYQGIIRGPIRVAVVLGSGKPGEDRGGLIELGGLPGEAPR